MGEAPGLGVRSARRLRCYDVVRLAHALTHRGHDVQVLTAGAVRAEDLSGDLDIVRMHVADDTLDDPAATMPAIGEMARHLVDHWDDHPPDVVHCHGWSYGMAAQLAANWHPVPVVQGFDGLSATPGTAPDPAIRLGALLARNATAVTAACVDDVRELIRLGCVRDRIWVLPCGIDIEEFTADMPAHAGPARHRVVAVARDFSPEQGFAHVVRALPALPSADLILVATEGVDDSDIARLLGLAKGLRVSPRIRVVVAEETAQLTEFVRSADVVVCPANYEPSAATVLQAMACGAAVVGTATGGLRDAVISDVTGLLVPPANIGALSRALRSVLGQSVLRQGMGLAGRARVRSRYSWDRIATDAERVYTAVADRRLSATLPR
ncbi:glycosyltransferase family 4 protein [Mycolicibacterium sp.]|uniref:glycosyltransferase family 4 protein n=1 Tax=Mycolicibacterium sp. TaxID=2320850 RepID=UPI003D09EE5E